MVSSTGKNFNQLGDYQYCRTQENFEYVTLTLNLNGFTVGGIGICAPNKCGNQGDFSTIMQLVKGFIPIDDSDPKLKVEIKFEVVKEVLAERAKAGTWIFLAVF
jgi:hypothetical protein